MTGLPSVSVRLDDGTGTFPHDVSSYARLSAGISGELGRSDEFDAADAGELKVTLEARDGRFTLGSAQYGCYVDQPIKITISKGSASRTYSGYIEGWPMRWASGASKLAQTAVEAVDVQAQLSRTRIASLTGATALGFAAAWWPLSEDEGSTSFGDQGGGGLPPLTAVGTGLAIEAGGGGSAFDGVAHALFNGGRYVTTTPPRSDTVNGWGIGFITTTPAGTLLRLGFRPTTPVTFDGTLTFSIVSVGPNAGKLLVRAVRQLVAGGITGGPPIVDEGMSAGRVDDGLPHYVSISRDGGSTKVTLDGVDTIAETVSGSWPTVSNGTTLAVGQGFTGTIAHVVAGGNDTQHRAVAKAWLKGAEGETVAERLQRIVGFAGRTVTVIGTPTLVDGVAGQTAIDLNIWDAAAAVVSSDGGLMYIDGLTREPVYVTWNELTDRAMQAGVEVPASLVDPGDLQLMVDKAYLSNKATATRPGGATQTVIDTASKARHGEYERDLGEVLALTDVQALSRAEWAANRYAEPRSRVGSLTVDMLSAPDPLAEQLLEARPGDAITVTGLPSQAGVSSLHLVVEGWSEEVTDDSWSITFNCSPAELRHCWVTEDPVYGAPDEYPATF